MKRFPFAVLASVGALLVLTARPAGAQGTYPYSRPLTNPFQRPVFSPYLNLLRPGGSVTQNYYGLVRPQQEFQNEIGQLQQQTALNRQAITEQQQDPTALPATGHATQFLNTRGYFFSRGGGQTGVGGGLTSAVTPPRTVAPPQRRPTSAGVATSPRSSLRNP